MELPISQKRFWIQPYCSILILKSNGHISDVRKLSVLGSGVTDWGARGCSASPSKLNGPLWLTF